VPISSQKSWLSSPEMPFFWIPACRIGLIAYLDKRYYKNKKKKNKIKKKKKND
jgi:hypothetical protein